MNQQSGMGDLLDALQEGENRGGSSSVNKLLGTLIPLLIVSIPMVLAFFFLRNKQHRVYAPRAYLDTLKDEEKTPKPAFGTFNWLSAFRRLPDFFLLKHQSLDNYLFIRYFRMLSLICLVGTLLTWPTLVAVNSLGNGGKSELDRATFSNANGGNNYYWHVVIAWLFVAFVWYIITKETIYYINLRQAFLTTPRNAARISTRIVLFTSIPEDYRNRSWIKADFKGVKRVWTVTDCADLEKKVQEMQDTANSLEEGEVKLSTFATKKHMKGEKHFSNDQERQRNITAQWISQDERPKKRINPPLIGRKTDAIEYYRDDLKSLIPKVKDLQHKHAVGSADLLPALFVEFESQRAAQAAFSVPFWNQPQKIEPACIGISSKNQVVWENLGLGKIQRWIRSIAANAFITALIILWSIPVGLVGSLGDLNNLAENVPGLAFLKDIPSAISSVLSGLLPALLVSALLALVPVICRFFARKAGFFTLAQVELKTQTWYFAFQVVQVFLITTFSSGAASVVKQIIDDPSQAPTLLADSLPTASNFYLSFFVLQGLTVTASTIFQIAPLLILNLLGPYLDDTPRKRFERWTTLPSLSWGDTYPKFSTFAIIAISYSCIAPLVLGFALFCLVFLYLAFRYNVFYVLTTLVDTNGEAYGLAMQQLSVGIYLSEICLLGLISARGAKGPAALLVVLLILTIVYQIYFNLMLTPLENTLSDELMAEDEEEALRTAAEQSNSAPINPNEGSNRVTPRAPLALSADASLLERLLAHRRSAGIFAPFLFHGSRSRYTQLRRQLWDAFPGQPAPEIDEKTMANAYHHPAITAKVPTIWLARDVVGVSRQEVRELQKMGIDATDEGAGFDDKGKLVWEKERLKEMPVFEEREEY